MPIILHPSKHLNLMSQSLFCSSDFLQCHAQQTGPINEKILTRNNKFRRDVSSIKSTNYTISPCAHHTPLCPCFPDPSVHPQHSKIHGHHNSTIRHQPLPAVSCAIYDGLRRKIVIRTYFPITQFPSPKDKSQRSGSHPVSLPQIPLRNNRCLHEKNPAFDRFFDPRLGAKFVSNQPSLIITAFQGGFSAVYFCDTPKFLFQWRFCCPETDTIAGTTTPG